MPGPPPKPAERRQRRNKRDVGTVRSLATRAEGGHPDHPEPGKGWLVGTTASWHGYWESDVSQLATKADHPALRRLWGYYDEQRRLLSNASKKRLVPGSTGQPVLNPLFKAALDLEKVISPLEDRFGLTPLSRLRLGVTFGDAHRSLADLNAELEADDDDAGSDDDPRFTVVDAEAIDATAEAD